MTEKIIKKYSKEFEEIYIRTERELPLDVIKDYAHIMKEERLRTPRMFYYLKEYIKNREAILNGCN